MLEDSKTHQNKLVSDHRMMNESHSWNIFSHGWWKRHTRKNMFSSDPALLSSSWLYNKLQYSPVLIIDCRPHDEFMEYHVIHAIHFETPKKRINTINRLLLEYESSEAGNLLARREMADIVVFDILHEKPKKSWGYKLAKLLREEGKVGTVGFMVQGFEHFKNNYSFLLHPQNTKLQLKYPNEIINQFLYLGNVWQSTNETIVKTLNITHIVSVGIPAEEYKKIDGIQYLILDIHDSVNEKIEEHFDMIVQYIVDAHQNENNRLMINCVQGISRSSTFVIVYIMYTYECTLAAAYSFVQRRRPIIYPNTGFMEKLIKKEKELYGINSILEEDIDDLQNGIMFPSDRSGSKLNTII